MSTTEQHIKRIQDKLQQLLKQYATVLKENAKLKEDLAASQGKLTRQQQTTDELKQQVSILKMNAVDMSEADKKEFEKRINAYVKEIDRCITLLGK
jgi:Skp family chaperone for outer membrane proteins